MVGVEFHFDFGSPNAYLAHLVIPEIERRTGVAFEYVPILLGGVFKLTNNRSPAESLAGIKNKPEYGEARDAPLLSTAASAPAERRTSRHRGGTWMSRRAIRTFVRCAGVRCLTLCGPSDRASR